MPVRRVSRSLLAITLALGVAASAHAQDEMPWYTVEVIVFERTSSDGLGEEQWPLAPGAPAVSDAIVLGGDQANTALAEETARPTDLPGSAFRLLATDELELQGVWESLSRSGAVRPVLHRAWRQPGYPLEAARSTRLESRLPKSAVEAASRSTASSGAAGASQAEYGPSEPPKMVGLAAARYAAKPYVGGTLTLHLARYLHVDADFVYFRPVSEDLAAALRTQTVAGAGQTTSPVTGPTVLVEESIEIPSVFRLTQSRRMRSRELHYLDHPMFGVIVQVTPFEGPGASAATFGLDSGANEAAPSQITQ